MQQHRIHNMLISCKHNVQLMERSTSEFHIEVSKVEKNLKKTTVKTNKNKISELTY